MPLYICRWSDGDWSAAFASNKDNAVEMFDEVATTTVSEIFVAKDFMIHLSLNQTPARKQEDANPHPFSVAGFGDAFESTHDEMYPEIAKVFKAGGEVDLAAYNETLVKESIEKELTPKQLEKIAAEEARIMRQYVDIAKRREQDNPEEVKKIRAMNLEILKIDGPVQ